LLAISVVWPFVSLLGRPLLAQFLFKSTYRYKRYAISDPVVNTLKKIFGVQF